MTEKAKNYTEDQVAEMTEAYNTNPVLETVKAIATEFGKTVPSVRGKLSSLGIYKPQVKATAKGKAIVRKDELVGQLESRFGVTIPSLVKATKADLEALVSAFMKEDVAANATLVDPTDAQIDEANEFVEGE